MNACPDLDVCVLQSEVCQKDISKRVIARMTILPPVATHQRVDVSPQNRTTPHKEEGEREKWEGHEAVRSVSQGC